MKWLTHYEDSNWKIEVTATQDYEFDWYFYQWEKSFIRLTAKAVSTVDTLIVNGEEYKFYSNGETSIIEITDQVRAFENWQVQIDDENGIVDYIEFYTVKGERQTADNFEELPAEIPYDSRINQNIIQDSLINESSNLYGFAERTVSLKAGHTYTFSANGNAANALNGKFLRIYIYSSDWSFVQIINISESYDITKHVTFTAPSVDTYVNIISFYYDETAPRDGSVKVNWYKLEFGNTATDWCPMGGETGYIPFYIQASERLTAFDKLDGGFDYYLQYKPNNVDFKGLLSAYDMYLRLKQEGGENQFQFIQPACMGEMLLFQWVSRFGVKKSWWFKIDREIFSSDKNVSLQTLDNNYNVLKNKRQSIQVSHKNADIITQKYLSDIVLSDEVYIYSDGEKLRVNVATNEFEVTEKKRDINLLINKTAYDTI